MTLEELGVVASGNKAAPVPLEGDGCLVLDLGWGFDSLISFHTKNEYSEDEGRSSTVCGLLFRQLAVVVLLFHLLYVSDGQLVLGPLRLLVFGLLEKQDGRYHEQQQPDLAKATLTAAATIRATLVLSGSGMWNSKYFSWLPNSRNMKAFLAASVRSRGSRTD